MRNYESMFLIIVIVCLLALAVFFIGGALQDVDYHDLADLPLLQQQSAYQKLETRRDIGEVLQLVSAIVLFVCFVGIMLTSAIVGTVNAEKPLKRFTKT